VPHVSRFFETKAKKGRPLSAFAARRYGSPKQLLRDGGAPALTVSCCPINVSPVLETWGSRRPTTKAKTSLRRKSLAARGVRTTHTKSHLRKL